ncbi:putative metabolite transport protein YwtG [Ceratocystis lukuohia]|uniref:Metabolite transport protein YwtG n=1 Tax=Ceratocystis lukuohia TaxID=2019550 RepID=A0ABR4M9Y4_9PEZI
MAPEKEPIEKQPIEAIHTNASAHHEEMGRHESQHPDMKNNLAAKIRNPLDGIPYDTLMRDVEDFTREYDLTDHTEVFRRGALVAQNPSGYDQIGGREALSEVEKTAIRDEVEHRWRMPRKLLLTIATCSIGAAVQGWDQTGSNGANLFFPKHYGIEGDKLLVGVVNAGPYISCALLGCWLSDPANHYLGRRGVIFVSANFCLWPLIGSAFAQNWEQQLITRLLMGIGMGIKASTVPIYAAENSPAAIRGALVMSWQMWTAFGIFLGTAFNMAVYHASRNVNWRLMLGAPALPAIPLLALIYLCPESPRWLMKKGRYVDAWKSIVQLRNDPIQAARDMYSIHAQLSIERQIIDNSTYFKRVKELFTIPRVRRANLSAVTVMLAQQLCGINIIAFYSSTIFEESGFSEFEALAASFGFGLINWLFAFPAFYTIDTFGRRSLLLFTFPNMMWTLIAAGLCTTLEGKTRLALVAIFIYMFAMFYSPGEGPVPYVYAAEVYPLSHREVGMGLSVAVCLGCSAILSITFPYLLDEAGKVGAFMTYAGFNAWAFVMIFLWVPETKQRTLEELDWVFAVPVRKFMRYQFNEVLPYWYKRYILRNKSAEIRPLYQVSQHEEAQNLAAQNSKDREAVAAAAASASE